MGDGTWKDVRFEKIGDNVEYDHKKNVCRVCGLRAGGKCIGACWKRLSEFAGSKTLAVCL
jgi:hypothetical protein